MNVFEKLGRPVDKVFGMISKAMEVISIIATVCIMLMLTTQTVLQWFSISLLWSDEVVSVLNIWLVFMAATVVAHENKHVQVDFLVNKLPKKVQILLRIVILALCIYACCTVFSGGITYIQRTRNIRTNILRLPMVTMYTAPLLGLGLMILMNVWQIIKSVAALFSKNDLVEAAEGGEA